MLLLRDRPAIATATRGRGATESVSVPIPGWTDLFSGDGSNQDQKEEGWLERHPESSWMPCAVRRTPTPHAAEERRLGRIARGQIQHDRGSAGRPRQWTRDTGGNAGGSGRETCHR